MWWQRLLSTAEAELYGIVDGAARGLETKHAMEDCGIPWTVEVATDATAARAICAKPGLSKKTRHVETKHLWVQDAVREKKLRIVKVDTEANVADMGTKALDGPRHQKLLKLLPLRNPSRRPLIAAGVEQE